MMVLYLSWSMASSNVEHFTDYIVDTFIDENSLFPPHVWAGEPSMDPKITNGPEAFHRDFNSQFYTCHPNYFKKFKKNRT